MIIERILLLDHPPFYVGCKVEYQILKAEIYQIATFIKNNLYRYLINIC